MSLKQGKKQNAKKHGLKLLYALSVIFPFLRANFKQQYVLSF